MADLFVLSEASGAGRVHVAGPVGESLPTAEQHTNERLWRSRALRSNRAAEQNAERSIRIDLACYRHGALLQERRGTPVPVAGEQKLPARDTFTPDGTKGWVITRVAAAKKKKALGPCELRALLRDAPSSPCTRHGRRRVTWHRRTLRSDIASYARALDRAHNLSRLRDEIGIASDHFKGG